VTTTGVASVYHRKGWAGNVKLASIFDMSDCVTGHVYRKESTAIMYCSTNFRPLLCLSTTDHRSHPTSDRSS